MSLLCENSGAEKFIAEELISKKVRFRKEDGNLNNDMMIDLASEQPILWKDKLVSQSSKDASNGSEGNEDFVILDRDIQKSFVNGVPPITFSDRIHQFLIQGMENTVILKLLGRNISFSVLQNKLYNLWRPSATLHMMDIENGYFLIKFQNKLDCEKALFEGHWIIFGQYLTVQPWTLSFHPTQAYPSIVMAWIRFPGLPGYLYNQKIVIEIGGIVAKVGSFARMAVYVDLDKPLVSQILINGRKRNVEYESLSTICFHYGRYGHVESSCTFRNSGANREKNIDQHEETSEVRKTVMDSSEKKDENYGPWMIIERRSRLKFRENVQNSLANQENEKEGSRFRILNNRDSHKDANEDGLPDSRCIKGKEIMNGNYIRNDDGSHHNGRLELGKKNNNYNNNGQAQATLGQPGSVIVGQQEFVAAGSSSSSLEMADDRLDPIDEMGLLLECNTESAPVAPILEGRNRNEESMAVGSNNSEKHTVVIFHDSLNPNNTGPSPDNNNGLSTIGISSSGKRFSNRGRGISKKCNKILHGNNT
ncbi:GroES-like zinc-binding alcohol dehydrogenase family protein [Gossypium australe]|uniref:GroES-like zinc-binding alcohol dehydrogenase family protein n=1 Tax=Gossypium australe TaxID=47621 RepID=A0A5B6VL40_9ROSI|nr:GroES-like zinc-binding alcohol dehydrogenase family protein [Gossypium australe]